MLPSLASMRDENVPPTGRSTAAAVVCQSSDAAFHCLMSSGVVHARQTSSIGAATVASTVIFMGSLLASAPEAVCPWLLILNVLSSEPPLAPERSSQGTTYG